MLQRIVNMKIVTPAEKKNSECIKYVELKFVLIY